MTEKYTYRNLIVWQRAQQFAHSIVQITQHVPRSWSNAVPVRQIVSAATSISANIAEGHGRYSFGAYKNHLSIAKGSAAETDSWLDLYRRFGWLTDDEEAVLHRECVAIMAMLAIKVRDLERRAKEERSGLRETQAEYGEETIDAPSFPFSEADYVAVEGG